MLRTIAGAVLGALPPARRFVWRAGRAMYCLARGDAQPNNIRDNGEADVQAWVVRALPPGVTLRAFDIGANRGEWTLSLLATAKVAGRSAIKVDLFEPSPVTVVRLKSELAAAGAGDEVTVNQMAVSDRAGAVRMAVLNESGRTNSLHHDDAGGAPAGGWIDVQAVPVNDFCAAAGIGHLHIVKCDAEGHDLSVLRGAMELIGQGRIDVFQFEYNQRWVLSRTYLKDAFDLIAHRPYRIGIVRPGHVEFFDAWHTELERFFEANYVIVHERALAWFPSHTGGFDASNVYRIHTRQRAHDASS